MKLKSLAWPWHPKSIGSIVRIWAYLATGLIEYPACHLIFVLRNSGMAWRKLQGIPLQGTQRSRFMSCRYGISSASANSSGTSFICKDFSFPTDSESSVNFSIPAARTFTTFYFSFRVAWYFETSLSFGCGKMTSTFFFLDILAAAMSWTVLQNFGTTILRTISLPKSLGSSLKHLSKVSIWDPSLAIFDEKGCLSNRLFIMNGCSPRIIFRNIEMNFSCAFNQEGVHPLASLKEDDFVSRKKYLRRFLLVVAP